MPNSYTPLVAPSPEHLGRFDHITHLPSRLQFEDYFSWRRDSAVDQPGTLVLVTLADARHYNEVLRALGMAFAENFVRAGARLLTSVLPPSTPIFHVSVLSFAFTIEQTCLDAHPNIATTIARSFSDAIDVDAIPIKTRVGVGLLPINAVRSAAESLRAALTAAQDSRGTETGISFYNHGSDAAHLRAFRILADLPAAIAQPGQLTLNFQPRIQMQTGQCKGAEALLRWTHPELGPISPAEFIPLVEQTALIAPLTDWVMATAMTTNRALLELGHSLRMSINASPVNLSEPGFDEMLLASCSAHRLEPHHVELEFTEGTLATNANCAIQQLARLRAAGVDVALDDFGSGYSNLSYLDRLPADVLKIDQSFVRPLREPGDDDFLLRQILLLAKGMGFRVCAEGIETRHAYDLLRDLGCDEAQGYYMARPMPEAEFRAWLTAHS
ncbi:GGDEF domain-containing phosphodiesterase [Devosia rhodophyticola]|uniref:GGDEF domain-containing phosphodiesterase n=1 Tax=Devosia rhodophyticola TaxID=3026423 RepID=A0ABY7YTF3_9HYPH|nr:GGDEF domain-containing phosphodiesterase [Devosia rhodophyticola]WDR04487.1 GGDEF domain-containing phosphodiesterase [Devosia rhodophyticola]